MLCGSEETDICSISTAVIPCILPVNAGPAAKKNFVTHNTSQPSAKVDIGQFARLRPNCLKFNLLEAFQFVMHIIDKSIDSVCSSVAFICESNFCLLFFVAVNSARIQV